VRSRYIPAPVRQDVEKRAAGRCEECGRTGPLAWHHRKPFAWGGEHTSRNLQRLCRACHRKAHGGRSTKSFRLSPETRSRIERLAEALHIPQNGVVELAVRLLAKRDEVE
jgi:5-methylcytosine-specific restriction endonuclease McrA